MENEKLDSIKELNLMSNDRLFCYQKLLLKQLRHYLENPMCDKNDVFRTLEVIDTINLVITKRNKSRNVSNRLEK